MRVIGRICTVLWWQVLLTAFAVMSSEKLRNPGGPPTIPFLSAWCLTISGLLLSVVLLVVYRKQITVGNRISAYCQIGLFLIAAIALCDLWQSYQEWLYCSGHGLYCQR